MFFIVILFEFLPFIIVPIIIISIAVKARKRNKDINNSLPSFNNTISNANDPGSFGNSNQDLSTYCEYCGSKIESVRKRCPGCGARVQKNNKVK